MASVGICFLVLTGVILDVCQAQGPLGKITLPNTRQTNSQRLSALKASIDRWTTSMEKISTSLDKFENMKENGFPNNMNTYTDDHETIDTDTNTDTNTNTDEDNDEDTSNEDINLSEKAKGFTNRQYAGYMRDDKGSGVSGMCASQVHPAILYYVNDQDSNGIVYAINITKEGEIVAELTLGASHGDWEDMACGPCNHGSDERCVFVGDIGKSNDGPARKIYKFKEPSVLEDQDINSMDTIRYRYYYNPVVKNGESFMVSPVTGKLYIMDEREDDFPLYRLDNGKPVKVTNVALSSDDEGPKAADISPDGRHWLFKMEDKIFYFYVPDENDLAAILSEKSNALQLPYYEEDYGTTIAWDAEGRKYYTVSEGMNEAIYFYEREK